MRRRILSRSGRGRALVECLESRILMSATPVGLTPGEVRHAYAFDQVQLTGAGQTIAIVDPYVAPTIAADLDAFDSAMGLGSWGRASQILTVRSLGATTTSDAGWALEAAMDVEWAHAIAPAAHILLVEAASSFNNDLLAAVDYARRYPGVSTVSMSWGGGEFSGESGYDGYFMTPAGHNGVTFVAAAGDDGAGAGWPTVSPYVLAVGGTTLNTSSNGTYRGESAWSDGGGGYSVMVGEPTYQVGVNTTGVRANPDVSYDADPDTGFAVYTATRQSDGEVGWFQMGGTSAGSPQWAALVALADQKRVKNGMGTLDGGSQTLPSLYSFSSADFHDVTTGSNGYAATPGFDLATGRGSPIAISVIHDLFANAVTMTPAYVRNAVTTTSTRRRFFDVRARAAAVALSDVQVLSPEITGARVTVHASAEMAAAQTVDAPAARLETSPAHYFTPGWWRERGRKDDGQWGLSSAW